MEGEGRSRTEETRRCQLRVCFAHDECQVKHERLRKEVQQLESEILLHLRKQGHGEVPGC